MRTAVKIILLVLLLTGSEKALAGDPPNIRGIGMARTISGLARGIGALGINPANLGMRENHFMTVNLAPVGLRISSDLISLDTYNEFFTGVDAPDGSRVPRYLTAEDKEKILSGFPEGVATSRAEVDVMPIGVSVYEPSFGGIGFAMMEHIGTRAVLPKDYVRIFLYGLDSAGSTYTFNETALSAWWWREYNLSYGLQIPVSLRNGIELYGGIGLKYVSGYGVAETDHYTSSISNIRENQNQYRIRLFFDYLMRRSGVNEFGEKRSDPDLSLFPAPAGTGFGVDLGFAARLPGIDLHLSITDIGSVSWKRNIVETLASYNLEFTDPFFRTNEDSIQNAVRGKNQTGSSFSTSLPTRVRIGVVVGADSGKRLPWFPKDLVLAMEISQGFNESMGNSGFLRFSLGTEYRLIPGVPLRTGISVGDDSRLRWAMGLGFDFGYFSFDLATENLGMLFSLSSFDMFSIALGFQIRS